MKHLSLGRGELRNRRDSRRGGGGGTGEQGVNLFERAQEVSQDLRKVQ